jgi:hypothetical protein
MTAGLKLTEDNRYLIRLVTEHPADPSRRGYLIVRDLDTGRVTHREDHHLGSSGGTSDACWPWALGTYTDKAELPAAGRLAVT